MNFKLKIHCRVNELFVLCAELSTAKKHFGGLC